MTGITVFKEYPISVLAIDTSMLICLIGGARFATRLARASDGTSGESRLLIYGAGDAGEMIVRDIKNSGAYGWYPIGFVDDDSTKTGRYIHGVKVLGTREHLPEIAAAERVDEVLVAIARAEFTELREILGALEQMRVPIKTLPNLRELLDGKVSVGQIKSLSLEDLMPRKAVDLDPELVRQLVNGRRVLVTGAGGSIGSELCRQVAGLGPSRLVLVDRNENALFHLADDLARIIHEGADSVPGAVLIAS